MHWSCCGRREDEEGCIEICDNCKSPWGTGINPFNIIINVLVIISYLILITITEPLSSQQSQNDFFLMIRRTLRSNQATHWGHAHGELPGYSLCFYSHIDDQQNICIISQVFLKEHDLREHNEDSREDDMS